MEGRPEELGSAVFDKARTFVQSLFSFLSFRPLVPFPEPPYLLFCSSPLFLFSQDDPLAVEFVTAAANLRSACFGIPLQSLFTVKVRGSLVLTALLSYILNAA